MTLGLGLNLLAQQGTTDPALAAGKAQSQTSLLFREDFPPGKTRRVQLAQDGIGNPNLELKLYGPGSKPGNNNASGLLLSNEEDAANNGRLTSMVFSGVADASSTPQVSGDSTWAVKTSEGIILIDSGGNYSAKELITDGLKKAGLEDMERICRSIRGYFEQVRRRHLSGDPSVS